MEFEAVIGLEVHVQLATESKIFCGCRARLPQGVSVADIAPNANTCPVCAGHPGTLPVLNRRAVEYAVRAGLATNCRINTTNVFARKNYFYPDLPKGYQTTQLDLPICEQGWIDILSGEASQRVPIVRIHMEEDAGKNLHLENYSLVNLNRAGVPLIEIVSAPELRSAEDAGAYLRALYAVVTAIGICDGNLQEGNFRCDANVSIRPKGQAELGTRTEIKNVNSFRFVEKAIEYEIARQIQVVQSGGRIVQETRGYDSDRNITTSMRSKEEAQDYRYFPEPDLIPVHIDGAWIEEIRKALPELPEQKKARYVAKLGLSAYDAGVLTSSRSLSRYFEESVQILAQAGMDQKTAAKPAANLLAGEVARLMNDESKDVAESQLTPAHVAEVVRLQSQNTVSSTGAKKILHAAWKGGEPVDVIVEREGLKQVSDLGALEPIVDQVLAANPSQAEELRAGKDKLMGFFVGQIMKQTGGKANPALLQELIRKKLGRS
jgi:aspartyl-tRNA(Asn)/glutamyl-tRNA(Gln) amidotransferase subunit B